MVKPVLSGRGGDEAAQESTRGVLHRCLADSLALLHPFMPFLTEEIWEKLTGQSGNADRVRVPGRGSAAERPAGRGRRRPLCARS